MQLAEPDLSFGFFILFIRCGFAAIAITKSDLRPVFLDDVLAAQKAPSRFRQGVFLPGLRDFGVSALERVRRRSRQGASFVSFVAAFFAITGTQMATRTAVRTVTFQHPFALEGFGRNISAGTYLVETEEELIDTILSMAWRRVSTVMRLRTAAGTQDVLIDPEQLNAALLRDLAVPDTSVQAATMSPAGLPHNFSTVRVNKS